MTATGRIVTAKITAGTVLRVQPVSTADSAGWAVRHDGSNCIPASNRRDSVPAIVTGIAAQMTSGNGRRAQRYYAITLETASGETLRVSSAPAQTHMLARETDWQPVPAAAPADLEPATDDAPLTAGERADLERNRARYSRPAVSLDRETVPASIAGRLQFLSGMPRVDAQPAAQPVKPATRGYDAAGWDCNLCDAYSRFGGAADAMLHQRVSHSGGQPIAGIKAADLEPAAQPVPAVSLRKPVSLAKRVRPATIVRRVPAALEPAAAPWLTLWLCVDCLVMLANGDDSGYEFHSRAGNFYAAGCEHGGPLSALPAGETVPGIGYDAHDCGQSPESIDIQHDSGDSCGCERNEFSRVQCDGCGCRLAGERNGATHFPRE